MKELLKEKSPKTVLLLSLPVETPALDLLQLPLHMDCALCSPCQKPCLLNAAHCSKRTVQKSCSPTELPVCRVPLIKQTNLPQRHHTVSFQDSSTTQCN